MKVLYAILISLFCCNISYAKTDFIANIPVDVEAENSVKAKDVAMIEAQRKGVIEVATRIANISNLDQLNNLTDTEILHFVQSVGVTNEKSGGTKYKADLKVEVNGELLKEYLIENELMVVEASNLIVIPVYKGVNQKNILWEDNNAWFTSWMSKGRIKYGSLEIKTISKNYKSTLTVENAVDMTSEKYGNLAQIIGNDKIYIIYAQEVKDGNLIVTIKNLKTNNSDDFTIAKELNESNNALYDRAIEKTVMLISNMQMQGSNEETKAKNNSITVVYEYANMKDWIEKSKNISQLPNVENIETMSMGGGKVSFKLIYSGSLDELWNSLQTLGFSHSAVDNYYVIR